MNKRNHNVIFHTHTVSGIVISVALYIIFFCGVFALFKDEISIWEKGIPVQKENIEKLDYDSLITDLKEKNYELYGRDISIMLPEVGQQIIISMTASKDSLAPETAKNFEYLYLDASTFETSDYIQNYHIGEFIYRLHFFSQIPNIGIYLSGLIALFFLFAIITGVIIHWKKIIPNFYLFRSKSKLKNIWADAHTVLGMIGLPFQFVYAVTSCFICLTILLLIPANFLYDNDQEKLMEDLRPFSRTYPLAQKSDIVYTINTLIKKASTEWDNFTPSIISLKNYGTTNMKLQVDGSLNAQEKFIGNGRVVYDVATNQIVSIKNPYKDDYLEGVELTLRRMHYGNYGGVFLKIIYSILAFITCFVIITGVLIWLESRNKKKVPAKQQLYNLRVGHIYMAICLTLFPVIAFSFVLAKILPLDLAAQKYSIYHATFFGLWLILFAFFRLKRDNYFTNKYTLLIGSVFGFLVPIANGIFSENWIWNTYLNKEYEILLIDLFWIFLSAIALFIALKSKRKHPKDLYKKIKEIRAKELAEERSNRSIKKNYNHIPMRTKIIILWIFIALGFIIHHIYGLFGVYYNDSLMMEGATGETPIIHHVYRILFEGFALLFGILTVEVSKKWFKWTSFVWAILLGVFNIYHFLEALLHEISNISEILILALMIVASIFLVINLNKWKNLDSE
ncbi:PepSY-associated TM helix domain-containing protein [Aquimarina sediminis]|uniref:PepSY-associated TM helix domain-containing protein n=1 Tax=Aquimarina sediminis TaxID=2070536 RepID=UPI000CA05D2B|nr:PepSY-associated TM helix domain-containing protein [Aquimarina sediminis]